MVYIKCDNLEVSTQRYAACYDGAWATYTQHTAIYHSASKCHAYFHTTTTVILIFISMFLPHPAPPASVLEILLSFSFLGRGFIYLVWAFHCERFEFDPLQQQEQKSYNTVTILHLFLFDRMSNANAGDGQCDKRKILLAFNCSIFGVERQICCRPHHYHTSRRHGSAFEERSNQRYTCDCDFGFGEFAAHLFQLSSSATCMRLSRYDIKSLRSLNMYFIQMNSNYYYIVVALTT